MEFVNVAVGTTDAYTICMALEAVIHQDRSDLAYKEHEPEPDELNTDAVHNNPREEKLKYDFHPPERDLRQKGWSPKKDSSPKGTTYLLRVQVPDYDRQPNSNYSIGDPAVEETTFNSLDSTAFRAYKCPDSTSAFLKHKQFLFFVKMV